MKYLDFGVVTLDVDHLTHRQVYQLVADCLPFYKAFIKSHKTELVPISQLAILEERLAALDKEVHKSKKSEVAKTLKASDKSRDNALDIFMGFIEVYAKFEDPAFKSAYDKLADLLTQYKGIKREPYQIESESLNHLLRNLAKTEYQSAIDKLALAPHISNLRTAQDNFERLYQNRVNEKTAKENGKAEKCREALLETFFLLVAYTAITVKIDSNKPHYIPLRDQVNTILTSYKKHKKKAQKDESTSDKTPTPTSEDDKPKEDN